MEQDRLRAVLRLYLVADLTLRPYDLPQVVGSCIGAGVTCVQLRAKDAEPEQILEVAKHLRRICAESSVPFIVNDHLDIALAVGADGVHLGVGDSDPEFARQVGGKDFVIGFSPDTDEQVRRAEARGVSYLGLGPLFGTATKRDAGAALGEKELARRVALSGLPTVAIGGIDSTNAHVALLAGADGVAVVSSVLKASDPEGAAAILRSVVDATNGSAVSER
jgi:thiamine-phosphate diphosphorylase